MSFAREAVERDAVDDFEMAEVDRSDVDASLDNVDLLAMVGDGGESKGGG